MISCQEKSIYINESDSCELTLYNNFTYKYSFPKFFNRETEKGNYEITGSSILLFRKSFKKIDSVKIGYMYAWNGTKKPDSLSITFKNLYNEPIKVMVQFNNFNSKFESNNLGEIKIPYKKLETLGIINSNEVIKKFTIFYENNIYLPDMSYYIDTKRPQKINFKLNQFIGKEYAILKRHYLLVNDTIYINDISRKSIGKYNKLVK